MPFSRLPISRLIPSFRHLDNHVLHFLRVGERGPMSGKVSIFSAGRLVEVVEAKAALIVLSNRDTSDDQAGTVNMAHDNLHSAA
jgi:hypothetical protein